MVNVYTDEDLNQVYKQRKKVLYVFWGVALGYLAICIACLCYHISLPYGADSTVPKIIVGVLSVAFTCFAFSFMSIKFRRVNKYYKMLFELSKVIKNKEENYFVKFENCDVQKDSVDA
ncbi:MAG: hypothetical protein IKA72_03035, partial [Clostridia bacterium]|nr:hypothetical protein [Clostridia bacterium]